MMYRVGQVHDLCLSKCSQKTPSTVLGWCKKARPMLSYGTEESTPLSSQYIPFSSNLRVWYWFYDVIPTSELVAVKDYSIYIMTLTGLESFAWAFGILVLGQESKWRWLIFLIAIGLSFRVPRTFLPNDFHGEFVSDEVIQFEPKSTSLSLISVWPFDDKYYQCAHFTHDICHFCNVNMCDTLHQKLLVRKEECYLF